MDSVKDYDGKCMKIPVKVNGIRGEALLDSGCTFNAISNKFAATCGLFIDVYENDMVCEIGGGQVLIVKRRVSRCEVEIDNLEIFSSLVFVMEPIPLNCDVILGMEFLKDINPIIDWQLKTLSSRPVKNITAQRSKELMEQTHLENLFLYREKDYLCKGMKTRVITSSEYEMELKQLNQCDQDTFCFVINPRNVESEKSQRYQNQCWEKLRDNPAWNILVKYKDSVFKERLTVEAVSNQNEIQHTIELNDSIPVIVKQFRLSPEQQTAVANWTSEMLEAGLIRPSNSPYSSPIFCIKKPIGWRIVHDYRLLNSKTRIPQEPIPRKDDIIESMGGSKWFSCMDLLSGYYQLMLKEENRHLTAFSTPMGHFEYLVTAQGLAGAPATFNRFVQHIFENLRDISRAFFDDIYIFTKSDDIQDHLSAIDKVLQRCEEKGLSIKLEKCVFVATEIPVLGDFVGRNGVRIDPDKVSIIKDWPIPRTRTQLKSFLGTIGYCARFCKDYGELVAPLHEATIGKRKNQAITLTEDQLSSFTKLKSSMSNTPTLALPNYSKPFGIRMDASDYAVGGVLYQIGEDGLEHPIAFTGRKMNRAELNYPVREKELLAIIFALKTWRTYLLDQPFTVETDHQTLQDLLTQRSCSQRLARWLNLLSEFQPQFKWIPGSTNDTADGISRRHDFQPTDRPASSVDLRQLLRTILDQAPEEEETSVIITNESRDPATLSFTGYDQAFMAFSLLSSSDISSRCKARYLNDPRFGPIWKHYFKGGQVIENGENTASHVQVIEENDEFPDFVFTNGLLWYKKNGEQLRLCIPDDKELKRLILFNEHDDLTKGHPGIFKTRCFVQKKYYWPKMQKYIREYINSCEKCQRNKHRQTRAPGRLNVLPIPEARWQHVNMDFILSLPEVDSYNSIWVIIDRLTKRAHFIPIKMGSDESSAKACAVLFRKEYQRLHGIPETIISDRDCRFTSIFWQELMKLQGSVHSLSSAFRPNTDGQSERTNRFIEDYLRNYVHASQNNWVELLYSAEIAYNSRRHDSIKMSPFEADLGYIPRTVPDYIFDKIVGCQRKREAHLQFQDQQKVLKLLKENLKLAQARMCKYYDRNRPVQVFELGDKVMISVKNLDIQHLGIDKSGSVKFGPLWIGPYIVIKKTSIDTYRLQLPIGLRLHPEFHTSLLKPYVKDLDKNRLNKPNESMIGADGIAEAFLIDDIIGHKKMKKKIYYLVKWLGYPSEYDTWEEHSNIYKPAAGLIDNYLERHGLDKKLWNPKIRISASTTT